MDRYERKRRGMLEVVKRKVVVTIIIRVDGGERK